MGLSWKSNIPIECDQSRRGVLAACGRSIDFANDLPIARTPRGEDAASTLIAPK
jgi:hypothetical protein